jgi:hypothetical protein
MAAESASMWDAICAHEEPEANKASSNVARDNFTRFENIVSSEFFAKRQP